MTLLDSEQIKAYLPHRYPMLLVDAVDELVLKERIVARKAVSGNEPFFEGHFPGNPVMPGVLQLEAMGQAGALLAVLSSENVQPGQGVYVGSLQDAKFKRPVRPGDLLVLHAELLRQKLGTSKIACRAEVEGKLVSSVTATITLGPAMPSPPLPEGLPAPLYPKGS